MARDGRLLHHGDVGARPLLRKRDRRQHALAARETGGERCPDAVLVENQQVLAAPQAKAPALVTAPADQGRGPIKAVAHQHHPRLFGQQHSDRRQRRLLPSNRSFSIAAATRLIPPTTWRSAKICADSPNHITVLNVKYASDGW